MVLARSLPARSNNKDVCDMGPTGLAEAVMISKASSSKRTEVDILTPPSTSQRNMMPTATEEQGIAPMDTVVAMTPPPTIRSSTRRRVGSSISTSTSSNSNSTKNKRMGKPWSTPQETLAKVPFEDPSGTKRIVHVVTYERASFPEKLHSLLSQAEAQGCQAIRWLGDSIVVDEQQDKEGLRDLLGVYFRHKNPLSLKRQLNTYGFQSQSFLSFYGRKQCTYRHPCFRKVDCDFSLIQRGVPPPPQAASTPVDLMGKRTRSGKKKWERSAKKAKIAPKVNPEGGNPKAGSHTVGAERDRAVPPKVTVTKPPAWNASDSEAEHYFDLLLWALASDNSPAKSFSGGPVPLLQAHRRRPSADDFARCLGGMASASPQQMDVFLKHENRLFLEAGAQPPQPPPQPPQPRVITPFDLTSFTPKKKTPTPTKFYSPVAGQNPMHVHAAVALSHTQHHRPPPPVALALRRRPSADDFARCLGVLASASPQQMDVFLKHENREERCSKDARAFDPIETPKKTRGSSLHSTFCSPIDAEATNGFFSPEG